MAIENKTWSMPDTFGILLLVLIVEVLLSWTLPTGQYQYRDINPRTGAEIAQVEPEEVQEYVPQGSMVPIPQTYQPIPYEKGLRLIDVITAPLEGFVDAVDVILFVLVIGGFIAVTMRTGAMDEGIARLILSFQGKEIWLIPILMTLFALGGTTFGMAEELIAFGPILLPVLLRAGFDPIVGVAVVFLGAHVGVLASTVNPFATVIAAQFAGVSAGEGIGLRVGMFILLLVVTIIYVVHYAVRVRRDATRSFLARETTDLINRRLGILQAPRVDAFTRRHRLVLGVFILSFFVMLYGVVPFYALGVTMLPTLAWGFSELTALFFVASILVAVVGGLSEPRYTDAFMHGVRDIVPVAFIIGTARGVTLLMEYGMIKDTLLHGGEQMVQGMPAVVFVNLVYLFHIFFGLFVSSSSGLATLTMPIIGPIAKFSDVPMDLVVTAFQSGQGWINLVSPVNAVLMAVLAMSYVPLARWVRFMLPLMGILCVLTVGLLSLGTLL